MTLQLQPQRYINFFEPFHFFTTGDQLVVPIGVTQHFFTATSNTIEGTGEKKKEQTNKRLGLTQVQQESYATLHFLWTYVD